MAFRRIQQVESITVDVAEVTIEGPNQYGLKISAFVKRGNRPLDGVEVNLFVAGTLTPGSPQTTDEGRVTDDITITTDAKSVLVEAQLRNTAVRIKKNQPLPQQPKKTAAQPHELFVRATGEEGKYRLTISVTSEDGKPVEDACVCIMSDRASVAPIRLNTDGCGSITPEPEIKFDEEERTVFVKVLGTEIKEERLVFFGPSKGRKPPQVPEPTEEGLRGSFLNNIRHAWKKGGDDLKRR